MKLLNNIFYWVFLTQIICFIWFVEPLHLQIALTCFVLELATTKPKPPTK